MLLTGGLLNSEILKNILLDQYTRMESICHPHDYPVILEVWPSIATDLPLSKYDVILNAAIPDDSNPEVHSQEAYISTTVSGKLPTNVLNVRDCVEEHILSKGIDMNRSEKRMDVSRERFEDLGYL